MTDYPAKRGGWRERQVRQKWRDLAAVFITALLLLAIFNGFWKGLSAKKFLGDSSWDGRTSLTVALFTKPASLAIYQPEPKRLVFLKLNEDNFFPTGTASKPLAKLSEIAAKNEGSQLTRSLSLAFGSAVEKYLFFEEEQKLGKEEAIGLFTKFAAITTPLAILSGKIEGGLGDTNIARYDLFKLWWSLKSLSVERLELVDLSSLREEVIDASGQKVLGVDDAALHLLIAKYLEISKFSQQDVSISVENASGVAGAGQLGADFIGAVGGRVQSLTAVAVISETTRVLTSDKDSDAAFYLANLFNCDINSSPETGNRLKVVIGRDFARRYFQ